ncbi:unnamed protein product, partial [marine sediment metagenome]
SDLAQQTTEFDLPVEDISEDTLGDIEELAGEDFSSDAPQPDSVVPEETGLNLDPSSIEITDTTESGILESTQIGEDQPSSDFDELSPGDETMFVFDGQSPGKNESEISLELEDIFSGLEESTEGLESSFVIEEKKKENAPQDLEDLDLDLDLGLEEPEDK